MLRPGNAYDTVRVLRYSTHRSFDAALYQLCAIKSRFAGVLLDGEADDLARHGEIPDDAITLSYEHTVALALGDDTVLRIAELHAAATSHQRMISSLERSAEGAQRHYDTLTAEARGAEAYHQRLAEALRSHHASDDTITIGGRRVENTDAAGALYDTLRRLDGRPMPVGRVAGVDLVAAAAARRHGGDTERLAEIRPAALAPHDPLHAAVPAEAPTGTTYRPLTRIRNMLNGLAAEAEAVADRLTYIHGVLAGGPPQPNPDIDAYRAELADLQDEHARLTDQLQRRQLLAGPDPERGPALGL